ncbi:YqaA family protein [Patescibacteria group bacterium]
MFDRYNNIVREWVNKHADSRHSRAWLGLIAFTDACCSPIPPDILLVPMLLIKNTRWISVAAIAAGWSVIGGVVGYGIGFFLFDVVGEWIITTYSLQEAFATVGGMFKGHAFITTFIAAFTPIPYKVFTISGGFFGISFFMFMLASILGRFLRYFIMAYLLKRFGEGVASFIFKKFNAITLVVVFVIVLIFIFIQVFI